MKAGNAGTVLEMLRGVTHINVDYAKTATTPDLKGDGKHTEEYVTGDEEPSIVAHALIQQAVTELRLDIIARAAQIGAQLAINQRKNVGSVR